MPTVKTLLPQKQADVQLIRVAAYCRVSSDSTEQKESFAAQVEYYTGLIGVIRPSKRNPSRRRWSITRD